ncbi:MAG TPA: tetratricopeptide repeat protein [Myxococcales bacterium]|nr:tetratricopeptide repeat protein [Myxococcales bacterium]
MTLRALAALVLALSPLASSAATPKQDDRDADAKADRKRDELIEDLRVIIPRMPEGDRRADLYFQLAELWWEKARYASLQEVRDHDDAVAKWADKREGEEPKLDTRRSDGYRKEAIRLYQEVLDRYPRYERRDEVLFVAGHNLYESGNREQGIAHYSALIAQYPKSRFVPDAWVQTGEHFFATNDLRRAREAFEKAASFHLPKLYAFALYKLAWCDYNAGAYAAAIAKFKEVIAYSEGEARGDRVQLRQEALKDIVLAYAHVDAIDGAIAYLAEKAGDDPVEAIQRLAATYFDDGKFEQAIRVYRILQERAPGHAKAPAWQQKILLAYDKLNRRDQVVTEMKRLVGEYGPQSGWAKANTAAHGALAEARDLAEASLRELVQDYHQEAIKTKSAATYRLARDIYRQYLDTFPQSESAASMRFYYAEILYALEEWDAAAAEYQKVVEADPKGPQAQRAAYDAILALEKAVAVVKGKLKKRELADAAKVDEHKDKGQVDRVRKPRLETVTRDVEAEPIPENEQRLIAACDRYLRLVPGAKDEIVIRYKAAFLFYERRHFVEAAKRFGEIILRWPTDSWSQKAAELSLDILNTRQEWQALSDLAQRFLENGQLCPSGSKFQLEVARVAEGARFKYALQLYEEKKDFTLAASEFRAFVARYPKSEYAPKALYDALLIADKADELDVEIAAGEQLMRDYASADPAIVKLTIPALANACERAGRYADAVRWYEDAQRRWPSDERAGDWLYNAAVRREGMGDDAGALRNWQIYLKQYRSRPDAAKIAFNVGLILERQKDLRRAADHWSAFHRDFAGSATAGQLLLARYKQGLALRELKAPDAAAVLADVPQRYARLPEAEKTAAPLIDAAAHARFLAVEPSFGDFMAIHFRYLRQADLVYVLKVKNARIARLLSAYGEVIAVGSPRWSEAAFERIGEAYRNFNKGLLDAPMPRGLDPEQQELYRSTLESQALPLEDKAVEAFAKAIAISRSTGVYSEWVIKAQDLLREYQPDAYGDVHRPGFAESTLTRPVAPELRGGP